MNLAFTLCSNNYLAHAKTLGDSLLRTNPGYRFVIILVDRLSPAIDYSFFEPCEIVPVEELGIKDFDAIWRKYNIVELNTAVKPSAFKYLFAKYPDSPSAFYFDPDILIYRSLEELEKEFDENDILLTPHVLTPLEFGPERVVPSENTFLNFGIYNLGFLGLKARSANTGAMLDWWESRTLNYGFINMADGFFVDQLWINLVPIYFQKVKILREMGYNMAPWNLHERGRMVFREGSYVLPDGSPLSFFHFSSYKYSEPESMAKHYNRFQFSDHLSVRPLYAEYQAALLANKIETLSKEPCYFIKQREEYLEELARAARKSSFFKRVIRAFVPPFFLKRAKKLYSA